jgi:hypothetical protein
MGACDGSKSGVRNRALIVFLWRTGLRISEALDLKTHHVDFDAKTVVVLKGKGSKRRTVGIDQGGDRVDRGDVEPGHGLRPHLAGLRPLLRADARRASSGWASRATSATATRARAAPASASRCTRTRSASRCVAQAARRVRQLDERPLPQGRAREFIGRVFNVMGSCPQHTFQVLTKRPKRMARVVTAYYEATRQEPFPNVWLGTSIESRDYVWRADTSARRRRPCASSAPSRS